MAASDNKSSTIKSAKSKSAGYQVGYGRPPLHTRFQKGRSGNPGGRPSRKRVERMEALALREAFRAAAVKEDGRMMPLTAAAAILRSQIELAAAGNLQAQREVLAIVRTIAKENEAAGIAAILGERAHNKPD
jgi:Family of unknown function (DUF5681)